MMLISFRNISILFLSQIFNTSETEVYEFDKKVDLPHCL